MNTSESQAPLTQEIIAPRAAQLFTEQEENIIHHTDRLFIKLMCFQWLFGIALALWISPRTWSGTESHIHVHVWAALLLGGAITSLPVFLAFWQPGKVLTRHAIAVGQMLMSALLIHLTGGRIETHFHVFGSLAILAFYRDWKVLASATLVVGTDHLLRGIFWPQSVYGVLSATAWRSLEHSGWVLFEIVFLCISIRKSRSEMRLVAERQARLEYVKNGVEQTVAARTADLVRENQERRQAEERLKRSQSQLAQAQQIAHMGSWEWNLVENRVSWSEEARRLFGRKADDSGETMQVAVELVHPDDRARVNAILTEALRTGEPFVSEHRIIRTDGIERIMQARGEILRDENGKPIKMLGIVQDITEAKYSEEALRQSHEQLRQSQKMEAVGRLAGGVAHDFNNLLTVITGYCGISLRQLPSVHPLQKSLVEIQKASERAGALTGQLLAFSRKQVLQPRVLQLNDVIQDMEKMLRRLIGEDVELHTTFAADVGNVKADRSQIEQVIMNLAVNARDAMPRGGKLTISTQNVQIDQQSNYRNRSLAPGAYVMLAVSDNGIGMTEEVKTHLFEPFFTTKGVGKGTGLGLATSYGIIAQSSGDIRVYSEPNVGTTFKIYLPQIDACVTPTPTLEKESLPGGTEKILVVEDDNAVRELAVTVLAERGYEVHESSNAFDGLEMVRISGPFDLVLTDVIMPRMSGKELRDQIRSQLPDVKVLLMSGYTDDALAHHGVLEEGISFLSKPFSPSQLTQKVRKVLDERPSQQRIAVASEAVSV